MKVLIVGGAGLIGRALGESLQKDSHTVWILSRNPRAAVAPVGVEVIQWDGKTPAGWENLVEEADAVVHLAGENIGALPWSPNRKAQIRQSREVTGRAVVEAVRQAGRKPAVLMQASGIDYYGTSLERSFNESDPPGSGFLSRVAVDWEASTRPVEDMGVRRVIIRSGPVLDATEGALPRMMLPFRLMVGGPLGSGRQWLSWIHRDDEIAAMRFLLEHTDASGPFNLASPNPVTNAQFGKALGRVMHRPYWIPAPAFLLQAVLGQMSSLILSGQRALPKRLLEMGFKFRYEHILPALEDLLGA